MENMKRELQIIQELMDQLQSEMEYSSDDLSERLGREKPGIEVVKMEGKLPMDHDEDSDMERAEEESGMDLDNDMEMGEDPEHAAKVLGAASSPEEELKRRLMKLRG